MASRSPTTLYLVQHGEATDETVDPRRPLTDKGRTDASKLATFLRQARIRPERIWHSAKTRAIETAQILAEALNVPGGFEQREGLNPNDPVERVAEQIQRQPGCRLMIVGHLPFLQKLAALLVAGSASAQIVRFQQAGVVCLEPAETARWQVAWAVVPELLQKD